jgi:hypothetical protein
VACNSKSNAGSGVTGVSERVQERVKERMVDCYG